MKKELLGSVQKLFISQKELKTIIEKEEIQLDVKGIQEDKFYGKNPNRTVLITSISAYIMLESHNIQTDYGTLGENILVTFNPYDLSSGTKISIGDCILEIANECTICNHLQKIDKEAPKLLKKDRGIFAKVLHSGTIKLNDSIELLN